VHFILNREELMDDPNYVVLMREVRKEGRSVARINGRTVNVGLLKELGALLIDIHGRRNIFPYSIPAHTLDCLIATRKL